MDSLSETSEYCMENETRGSFTVFVQDKFEDHLNIHLRNGFDVDLARLEKIARKLGFENNNIKFHRNFSKEGIRKTLEKMSKETYINHDCFVCVILSHAGERDSIYATDAEMHLSDFMKPFKDANCPTLKGKPKLFFTEACGTADRATISIPTQLVDSLVVYAHPPCPMSSQDLREGSTFVQVLHDCFHTYGHLEIMRVLLEVNRLMLRWNFFREQMPVPILAPNLCTTLIFKPRIPRLVELACGNISSPNEFRYNMDNKKRGYFMMFIHDKFDAHLKLKERPGAEADCNNLKRISNIFGFECCSYRNLRRDQIRSQLKQVKEQNHRDHDCFVCAISSHGGKGDIIYAKDEAMHLSEFMEPFNAENCPSLKRKPKLFFIQACRGHRQDKPAKSKVKVQSDLISLDDHREANAISIPAEPDFLIAHASQPDFKSWRSTRFGSWFVQELHNCFRQHAHEKELIQIMTKVNYEVGRRNYYCKKLRQGVKQMSSITTHLRAEVKFQPKQSEPDHDILVSGVKRLNLRQRNRYIPMHPHKVFTYNMENEKRGCFMIFAQDEFNEQLNIQPQNKADTDCDLMTRIAEKLKFQPITVHRNLCRDDICQALQQVRNIDHSNHDCFACVILSHGGEQDTIYAKDAKMRISEFMEPFNATNCPTLSGKPKLFFIQNCKSSQKKDARQRKTDVDSDGPPSGDGHETTTVLIPAQSDFLIAQAFLPHSVTGLNTEEGNWFVQALHKCFFAFSDELELMQIMTKVNNLMVGKPEGEGRERIFLSVTTRLRSEVEFKGKASCGKKREKAPERTAEDDYSGKKKRRRR